MNRNILLPVIMAAIIGVAVFFFTQSRMNSDTQNLRATKPPAFLVRAFPKTDWQTMHPSMADALSGGPSKDGIPALDHPAFIPIDEFTRSGNIQAIVLQDGDSQKVYPYNIILWHEIVNDTIGEQPVVVTFCPLCGSAIVYDRTLADRSVATFGVSGALLESNLLMYDHATESFWQQSTGKALAGVHTGETLRRLTFQLLPMDDVRRKFPHARVLSEETGHGRDYAKNPYAGYETDGDFLFAPSKTDARYPSKVIFVAFNVEQTPVAVPWLTLKDGETYRTRVGDTNIVLQKRDGELTITDEQKRSIPFYFEMWFSWAVQHGEQGIVFDPSVQ